jgi:IclR family acetate operon transcriptional repressor
MADLESLVCMPQPPAYHIASVGRALNLLSVFATRRLITVSEAAEVLDVAPSTAHRMLQMLVYHGFVTQAADRSYRRGPAIDAFRSEESQTAELVRIALPRLIALRDALPGGTPHLIALEGNGGRFLTGVQCRGDAGVASLRTGWLLPAHTLAGGKALLACLDPAEVESLYPDGVPATRLSPFQPVAQLQARLEEVRAQGYALSRDAHESVYSMAVAVPAESGPRVALSVGWDRARFPAEGSRGALRLIREAALDLAELFAASHWAAPAAPAPREGAALTSPSERSA